MLEFVVIWLSYRQIHRHAVLGTTLQNVPLNGIRILYNEEPQISCMVLVYKLFIDHTVAVSSL